MLKLTQSMSKQIQQALDSFSLSSVSNQYPQSCMEAFRETKQKILESVSSGVTKIQTVEQKYRSLVVSVGQQLQLQKEKTLQYQKKYQQEVLLMDQYKMEIVHYGQIKQSLQEQNRRLQQEIQQLRGKYQQNGNNFSLQTNNRKNQMKAQWTQTEPQPAQQLSYLSYNHGSIVQELEHELQQQRELLAASNQRCENLLHDNKALSTLLSQEKQTCEMLKEEVRTLNSKIKGNQLQNEEIQIQIQTVKNKNLELMQQVQEITINWKERSDEVNIYKELVEEKEKEIQQLLKSLAQSEKQVQNKSTQLQKQVQNLQKNKVLLNKLLVKIDLLEKHSKQQINKVKYYKSENDRLYMAMQQYEKTQNKLNKKVVQCNKKIDILSSSLEHSKKQKQRVLAVLKKVGEVLKFIKNGTLSEQNGINTLLNAGIKGVQQTLTQGMRQIEEHYALENKKLYEKIKQQQEKAKVWENSLKIMQKSCIQSEQMHAKICSSIMQQKTLLCTKISQKQQIIKGLESELAKQRSVSVEVVHKVSEVVNNHVPTPSPKIEVHRSAPRSQQHKEYKDQFDYEIQEQLRKQRNRFLQLQCEYQMMVNNQ